MSSRRPSILNKSSTQTTKLPTQEDQIRGYRAMTRGRYQAARATRRVFGRNNYNITLESVVDPERQLELSRERRANLVPSEIFMIRLHALHRRSAGTNALVVLRDTIWEDSQQIIGTMEVDLSAGTQLVYMFPDMVLSIDDFHNHVEVAIQTHGYDTWQGAIPGERRSVEELEGMSWNLKPSKQTTYDLGCDERGGGKICFLHEQFSQNQQDFLDEYLPQWDDQLAIQKQKSEMEWENPFAAKHGEDHTVLHLSKNEEKDDDCPYQNFRKFKQLAAQIINKHEEHAFLTSADDAKSSTSYQPPPDAIMGPTVYPPARQNTQLTYKPD
ncbi:hypothetical protein Tco_0446177 [Tanacetum coccineum]